MVRPKLSLRGCARFGCVLLGAGLLYGCPVKHRFGGEDGKATDADKSSAPTASALGTASVSTKVGASASVVGSATTAAGGAGTLMSSVDAGTLISGGNSAGEPGTQSSALVEPTSSTATSSTPPLTASSGGLAVTASTMNAGGNPPASATPDASAPVPVWEQCTRESLLFPNSAQFCASTNTCGGVDVQTLCSANSAGGIDCRCMIGSVHRYFSLNTPSALGMCDEAILRYCPFEEERVAPPEEVTSGQVVVTSCGNTGASCRRSGAGSACECKDGRWFERADPNLWSACRTLADFCAVNPPATFTGQRSCEQLLRQQDADSCKQVNVCTRKVSVGQGLVALDGENRNSECTLGIHDQWWCTCATGKHEARFVTFPESNQTPCDDVFRACDSDAQPGPKVCPPAGVDSSTVQPPCRAAAFCTKSLAVAGGSMTLSGIEGLSCSEDTEVPGNWTCGCEGSGATLINSSNGNRCTTLVDECAQRNDPVSFTAGLVYDGPGGSNSFVP
jgi:hypothetical protein